MLRWGDTGCLLLDIDSGRDRHPGCRYPGNGGRLGVVECLDLGFVEKLPELAPHGIQHNFGQSAESCIVLDFVVLQADALVLIVLLDLLLVVTYPFEPTAGFLFDIQPGVDVVFEETLTGFGEMPHLVDVLNFVPNSTVFCSSEVHHVSVRARSRSECAHRWDLFEGGLPISSCTQVAERGKVSLPA